MELWGSGKERVSIHFDECSLRVRVVAEDGKLVGFAGEVQGLKLAKALLRGDSTDSTWFFTGEASLPAFQTRLRTQRHHPVLVSLPNVPKLTDGDRVRLQNALLAEAL